MKENEPVKGRKRVVKFKENPWDQGTSIKASFCHVLKYHISEKERKLNISRQASSHSVRAWARSPSEPKGSRYLNIAVLYQIDAELVKRHMLYRQNQAETRFKKLYAGS